MFCKSGHAEKNPKPIDGNDGYSVDLGSGVGNALVNVALQSVHYTRCFGFRANLPSSV